MKKILFITLFVYLPAILAQSNFRVSFTVYTGTDADSQAVYITGNNVLLGNWNPSAVKLSEVEKNKWKIELNLPAGKILEFKFTRGSWNNEAAADDGTVPGNYILTVSKDTQLVFNINNWKKEKGISFKGQITGDVRYHNNFPGKGIKPRDIIVWLPPGYSVDSLTRYPVLYAHDGQNIIDPATSAFEIDWQLDETADSLINNGLIEPIIIVGIYNTSDRTAEYSNTDTGKAYMQFIVDELKPFIDKNYRTKPGKENTATIGSSMGGLVSFMLVWEYSNVFSKAACLSPAFHIANINYLPAVENLYGKKDIKIYIDNGGIGLEQRLQPGIDEMLALLKDRGYTKGTSLYWYKDEDADHNEAAWASRSSIPLVFFFNK